MSLFAPETMKVALQRSESLDVNDTIGRPWFTCLQVLSMSSSMWALRFPLLPLYSTVAFFTFQFPTMSLMVTV